MAQSEDLNSLFVDADDAEKMAAPQTSSACDDEIMVSDEEERDLNRAIAMSLENQYGHSESEDDNADFEAVPMPSYEQKAVEAPKPLTNSGGRMVAQIVNNRANATVRKQRATSIDSDDSDMDLKAVMAASRKLNRASKKAKPGPMASNIKDPFDGPLPFEKLDFKTSLFTSQRAKPQGETTDAEEDGEENWQVVSNVTIMKKLQIPLGRADLSADTRSGGAADPPVSKRSV